MPRAPSIKPKYRNVGQTCVSRRPGFGAGCLYDSFTKPLAETAGAMKISPQEKRARNLRIGSSK